LVAREIRGWSFNPSRTWFEFGWRLDLLVDLIEIEFTTSPTLQPRISGRVVVYRPLVPHNQDWAINVRQSRRWYENKFKLRWPNLVMNWPNLGLRQPTWGVNLISSSNYWQPSLVHVINLLAPWFLQRSASTSSFSFYLLDKLYWIIIY
jgi:hypothetical protein